MQTVIPPSHDQLRAVGQKPLLKVEIDVGGPVNLCDLDGKNYVEDVTISLGGAGMTPDPIGGTLSVTLSNEGSIFHPLHPDSGYEDYIKVGRKISIFIGGTYAGVPYYWQRIVGYIDEPDFEALTFKVNISGADYMKFLEDLELRSPDTLWRGEETFSTIASDGRGATEYYEEDDAMDIPDEADNVTNWTDILCAFTSEIGATDNTGDTTLGSPVITDMTVTSGFFIGGYVQVSAGFAAGTHKILEITADSITLDVNATGDAANVTVLYYVGHVLMEEPGGDVPTIYNRTIFDPEVGARYDFGFWYKSLASAEYFRVTIYQWDGADWHRLARREDLGGQLEWTEESLTFIAATTDPIEIWIEFYEAYVDAQFWFDLFTIRKYTPPAERYYKIAGACNGIYRVLLKENGVWEDVWQGEEDEGYYYTEEEEFGPIPPAHPPKIVWFDKNRVVANGTDNLKIQYFITVSLVDMVADILVTAGLYANRAAALDAMDDHLDWVDPAIDIDKCWFKVGEPALGAIRMICERANYRFFFTWEGKPAFIPAPAPVGVSFAFTEQGHIASVRNYQDRGEIWNRIIIEGKKRADPVNLEEARSSEFRGEAADDGEGDSIDTYGERTKTIKNHLFQNQTDLDDMCDTLLAKYKDPKWYADIEVPFNPVPLELGDKITWLERLSPTEEITQTGIIRDIKISTFNTIYKCVIVAEGEKLFVAVSADGGGNQIMTSPDGETWTLRTTPAAPFKDWQSITYGDGLFVCVATFGTANKVMTSPDGETWTLRTTPADYYWRSVTYGNGVFVAVANTGIGNRVMTSPDGETWTLRSSAANNYWRSVCYGNGLFVAVGSTGTGNRVMTSPDGETWTIRESAADNDWQSVTYGDGLFVAVAVSGSDNRVMTSPNGIDWTIRESAANLTWKSVTYGNGLFVAVADSGGTRVMTSPNGIDWTLRSGGLFNDWRSVTYGNGLFVAVARDGIGNRVMTSPNGIDWTLRSSAADNEWYSVVYAENI